MSKTFSPLSWSSLKLFVLYLGGHFNSAAKRRFSTKSTLSIGSFILILTGVYWHIPSLSNSVKVTSYILLGCFLVEFGLCTRFLQFWHWKPPRPWFFSRMVHLAKKHILSHNLSHIMCYLLCVGVSKDLRLNSSYSNDKIIGASRVWNIVREHPFTEL